MEAPSVVRAITRNGSGASSDLVSGRIDGQSLETRAAATATSTMNANAQLSWLYTGTNRASVLVAAEADPANLALRKDAAGLHGKIEVVGIVSRSDGAEAARFADTVNVDFDDQQQADAFLHTPWHYQHQFTAAAGSYLFRRAIGAGPAAIGNVETPLTIQPMQESPRVSQSEISHSARQRVPPMSIPGSMRSILKTARLSWQAVKNSYRPQPTSTRRPVACISIRK